MATDRIADDLPGNAYTMHPAAGANFVDIPNSITNAVMVEINPVLQMGSMTVTGMMNRFKEVTSEKNSKFAGINLVVSIAFRRDKFVTTWFVDNKFVQLLVEVAIQPAGHRASSIRIYNQVFSPQTLS